MAAPDTDKELEQHSLNDEPMSARDERREGMMMTTPYPNGNEPSSYPGQVPQPPAVHYGQAPSLLLSGGIRVNPQEKHHSVAVLLALSSLE